MQTSNLISRLKPGAYMLDLERADSAYTKREPYHIVDGIAVIDVCGLLVNDAGYWGEGYYFSSYERIQGEIIGAIAADEVKGILLRVDSPGGETTNAFETANLIYEAAKIKPVWAVASMNAYSAAYLIASAATAIFAPEVSGGLGSIGVYMIHMDYSSALEKMGIKATFIQAGEGKTDGNAYEPISEAAMAEFQSEVTRLYDEFVAAVSRGRGIDSKTITDQIGARTYHGAKALLENGLADEIGSFEEVMQKFRAEISAADGRALGLTAVQKVKGASKMAELFKPRASATVAPKGRAAEEEEEPKSEKSKKAKEDEEEMSEEGEDEEEMNEDEDEEEKKKKASAYQRGYNAALEIVSPCSRAGAPIKKAASFLRSGKSVSAVRNALMESVLDAEEETQQHSAVGHKAGVEDARATGNTASREGLLKAVENLGKGIF